MSTLNQIQRRALDLMAAENLGCLLVPGFGWVWPTNIRNDHGRYGEDKAIAAAWMVIQKLEAK